MTETIDETTGEILTTGEVPEEEEDTDGPADDDTDEEGEADEPEAVAATPPEADDEHQAEIFGKAIKRARTYMDALPGILGESFNDLALCPRCLDPFPGYVLPLNIRPLDLDKRVAVKLSIGELGEPEYKQADDAFTCDKCDGEGKVKTGSKLPSQATATCLECRGRGWVGPRSARVAALAPEDQAVLAVDPSSDVEAKPVADPWGRTIDDPLYGVMPGFERA